MTDGQFYVTNGMLTVARSGSSEAEARRIADASINRCCTQDIVAEGVENPLVVSTREAHVAGCKHGVRTTRWAKP